PLLEPSTLPFGAPPFDRIQDSDYEPALDAAMAAERTAFDAIANDSASATFANTIEAMERAGEPLRRLTNLFLFIAQANTSPALQAAQAEIMPKLAAHEDAIHLDPKLFARVKAVYDARATRPDPEQRRLAERIYRDFVRAGAELSPADQTTLRALNQEQSKLITEFDKRLLDGANASAIVVDRREDLDGLPESEIAAAAEAAAERGLAGKWLLTLQNTTEQPELAYLTNRALRERLHVASSARGRHGGDADTCAIVLRLSEIRAEQAKLLGFPNFAAYHLDDEMAGTPEKALALLTDMVPAATAKARGEAARMQQMIDADGGGFTLAASDWPFYAERVRQADYDLDEDAIRPYFEFDRVLQDGVFFAATTLYGITFKERRDVPVYHADVRVFEVNDADGSPLGLFYIDPFARSNKAGGAYAWALADASTLLGTTPIVTNTDSFTKPAPGQPALISFTDVTTMFHEFGHALHSLCSRVRYPSLNDVDRDFVELPSQFNEHWALEPDVLARYARHHEIGAPMPSDLVEKIQKTKAFNQGFRTTEYLAAALLDLAWHMRTAGAPEVDVNAFERDALARFTIDLAQVPPRYHTTYFSHIWSLGYAASYYAYLWSEVLDCDAYYWFKEHGGMTRENGQRFRDLILSRGNTEDPAELFRAFRGRDPVVEPLLIERGLQQG
ncbi:MAG TPA: M3 family metallopeptidase, partial [Vicinamibacterales bacterium]|nr:M3 family metallopeptidase [Vicinamibacterales bacterium]